MEKEEILKRAKAYIAAENGKRRNLKACKSIYCRRKR